MKRLTMGVLAAGAVLLGGAARSWGAGQSSSPAVRPIQVAQRMGPGSPGSRGGAAPRAMSAADRAQLLAEMHRRMLEEAGLTGTEKAAAEKALKARDGALSNLAAKVAKLREIAGKPKPTDKELRDALAAARAAVAQYHKTVAAEDAILARQLSPKSQARAMLSGILDNGGGMGGRGMRGGGGGSGRGGGRGGGMRGGGGGRGMGGGGMGGGGR